MDGKQLATFAGPVQVSTALAGELALVSGRAAAIDPAYPRDVCAFNNRVPTGRFPVLLTMVRYKDKDQRIAAARIQFADELVVNWKPARPGAYGVDSGMGAFLDAEAARQLARLPAKAAQDFARRLSASMDRNYADTRSFGSIPVDRRTGANIIAFSSGFGDGGYGCYLGFDARKRLVCLMTDFGLLLTQEEIDEMDTEAP